jgi:hypothetical protein
LNLPGTAKEPTTIHSLLQGIFNMSLDKSYVTMEQHLCPICGKAFDTGNLFLDQKLRKRFESHTCTGWSFCPEHKEIIDDGYIALVGIDETKSTIRNNIVKKENAYRTGNLAFIREERWKDVFNVPVPKDKLVFLMYNIN